MRLNSRGVGPVCLPYPFYNRVKTIYNGDAVTAIGYGSTQYALGAASDFKSWILQKVSLNVDNTLGDCPNDANKLCVKGAYINPVARDTCQVKKNV